jgi:hypothetical protein
MLFTQKKWWLNFYLKTKESRKRNPAIKTYSTCEYGKKIQKLVNLPMQK